jgi:hypothetical protein
MVARNMEYAMPIAQGNATRERKTVDRASMIGKCLNCGTRLTRCGTVFSAEIRCPVCAALNIYSESQQPVSLLLQ